MAHATIESKSVLTTGDVSRITGMGNRTVCKWIDTGELKGFRIPGSRDRRVKKEVLIHFLKKADLPLGILAKDQPSVLFVGGNSVNRESLSSVLAEEIDLHYVSDTFECGLLMRDVYPDCLVIDFSLHGADMLAHSLSMHPTYDYVKRIAVVYEGGDCTRDLFFDVFRAPVDENILASRLKKAIEGNSEA